MFNGVLWGAFSARRGDICRSVFARWSTVYQRFSDRRKSGAFD
ncbi:hypothetical protein C4K02_4362 [Pseudomonas synxantha]|nr:hypothetical protein C4K02_4362 [Pseudomonas synxantha]